MSIEQYMPFIWIGFAVIMAVCEAFTSQLVSIWFVFGAISAAITSVFTQSVPIQSAVFLVVSLVALLITRPLVKRFKAKNTVTTTNADRLIGKVGVILSEIKDTQSVGQVKVEGSTWSAKSDVAPISKDTNVKVLAIEGVKLIVEPINN